VKLISKHPIFVFSISRYFSYGLLFIRGFIIAKFLGPYFFGIWGFITLVLQYFSYSTFGINYAVTVQLSTESQKEDSKNGLISSTALLSTLLINLIILSIGVIIHFSGITFFSRYDFNQYLVFILLIAGFNNLQHVLINIYRVQKKIFTIAIVEIVTATILLVSAVLFKEDQLIRTQLWAMGFTGFISLMVFISFLPFKFQLRLDSKVLKSLLTLGFPLLIYNLSFYLIMISARTIVSAFYSLEVLGFFTLANSIASATLLGLQSVAWTAYPDVLSKTTKDNDLETTRGFICQINTIYNTSCFLFIFTVIFLLPILIEFLPQYLSAFPIITILLMSQAVLSTSFGFNALAISRSEQNRVAIIGFGIVLFVLIFSLCFSSFHLNFIWIALSVLLGSFLYTTLQLRLGSKLLGSDQSFIKEWLNFFPVGTIVAILINLFGCFNRQPILWSGVALVVFIITNYSSLNKIWLFIIKKSR